MSYVGPAPMIKTSTALGKLLPVLILFAICQFNFFYDTVSSEKDEKKPGTWWETGID